MDFQIKEVEVDKIKVKNRQRKYIGDITPLKKSMKEIGLINPIVISDDYILIAGYRRLLSARELGWKKITARIISSDKKHLFEDIEFDENYARKNLFQEEVEEIIKKQNSKKKGILRKFIDFLKALFS
ncbi:MAG: ParB N-terminal domain-containing protein [Brevinematales bacterium]|nr:ParB N-terminal domain-containing protein [Brevinematales bacterium]